MSSRSDLSRTFWVGQGHRAGVRVPQWFGAGVRAWPRWLKILAACALGLFVAVIAGAAMWSYVLFPSIHIPDQQPKSLATTTKVYAADGKLIASLHGEINREPVPLGDLPPFVAQAAVASEDARFYEHGGVDTRSIVRALVADIAANAWVQGGSTITQQYVKDAYVGNERSFRRKIQEARLARQLEREMSKDEILELYLNTVYFGQGAYGIQAAAKTFFHKPAAELTLSEAAELIGLIPSPARFSPYEHPEEADRRRVWVLDRMQVLGLVGAGEADAARAQKPQVVPLEPALTGNVDPAAAWFLDAVKRYLYARYGAERVLTGGLQVHTTLDPKLQEAAERILARNLNEPTDPYAALASVDPETGFVKALVGGRDYAHEKYNIAVQGRRQPGSAFKPFVLVAALEEGISPSAVFSGPSTICLSGWKPDCHVSNFGGSGFGRITLAEATVNSVNTVFAQLVLKVGADKVVDVAGRMGIPAPEWMVPAQVGCRPIHSAACRTSLAALPSLALGSQEVTPLEMASAYATLAASGVYREPKVVSKIVDGSGKVLEDGPSDGKQVIARDVAEEASRILGGVISRGTGRRANIGRPAAGKTGTAQDFRNAWFVGYTKEMSTAIWTGFRDSNLPLIDIHGFHQVTGGTIPAMMWAQYMSDSDLEVVQSAAPGPFLVGRKITQMLSVSNAGPWPAPSVTLTYALPAGAEAVESISAEAGKAKCEPRDGPIVCELGDMEVGAKVAVTVVLRPRAAGTFTGEATVRGGGTDPSEEGNVARREFVVVPAADVSVGATTAREPQLLGTDVTYTSTVTNSGPSPATEVMFTQSVPRSASFVSAAVAVSREEPVKRAAAPRGTVVPPPKPACSNDEKEVRCLLGNFPVGGTATVTVVVRPSDPGQLQSSVSVKGAEADGARTNNRAKSTATVIPAADVAVTTSVSRDPVPIGHKLVYTYDLLNRGPSPAHEATLTVILPTGASVGPAQAAGGRCSSSPVSVVCRLGALDVEGKARATVEVTPWATGRAAAEAKLTVREADPTPGDTSLHAETTVVPSVDLRVTAKVSPAVVLVGGDLTYEVYVTNDGISPATEVVLTNQLPEGTALVSATAVSPASRASACRAQDRTVLCTLGGIGVRERARVMLVLRPAVGGKLATTFEARGAELDERRRDNVARAVASVATGSAGSPGRRF